MKLCLSFALLSLASCACAISFVDLVSEEWNTWKQFHGKTYSNADEAQFRLKVFMENKAKVARHNHGYHKGEHTYSLKMNHFGDLLPYEFVSMMNGFTGYPEQRNFSTAKVFLGLPNGVTIPKEVDWRKQGAVTAVKDQGQCGSCWAFSTTGALEGQHFRKTGKLVSLSEQNLMDCSRSFGNHGCGGGTMDAAFKYIQKNHGIDTEASYPYLTRDAYECHFTKANIGSDEKGYMDVKSGCEQCLTEAIATVGPVAIAFNAGLDDFMLYHEGVYMPEGCDPDSLDHGVLAVGYGHDDKSNTDYFLVKNSWAAGWGDKGYFKIARNKNNMCGVASMPSYPLV